MQNCYLLSEGREMLGICNSCNTDIQALPDMYALCPRAYILGKARMPRVTANM